MRSKESEPELNLPRPDKIIRSNRRTYCIQINAEGELILRLPLRFTESEISIILLEKREWILKHQKQMQTRAKAVKAPLFEEGALFPFMGNFYPLKSFPGPGNFIRFEASALQYPGLYPARIKELLLRWYLSQANEILPKIFRSISADYSFKASVLRISDARSRWGSCNSSGSISLSWRLVMLPEKFIRCIIIHELAHLKHLDHSRSFYVECFRIDPAMQNFDHELKIWMKEHPLPEF